MEHHGQTILISLCTAISAGIFLAVLSRVLRLPAIILLLGGGIVLGPEVLGVVQPDSFGDSLTVLVSLAVGLILFEGGLALDWRGYLAEGRVIKRLLSVGVLITWLGVAALVYGLLKTDVATALLCGSLVIVTGPTVIVPLLKRLQIVPRLHNILRWEGVVIDSIGVFIALLCYEWIVTQSGERALTNFLTRIVVGAGLGIFGGWLLAVILRRELIPHSMRNVFAVAWAVLIFGGTEALMPEAGLLSVTSAGLMVGWLRPMGLREVIEFKAEISDLLVGALFILLAARLDLRSFAEFGQTGALVVLLVMLAVRPLNVLVCTWGAGLNWREKSFLAWVAPRGIVAASMASLFKITLQDMEVVEQPELLETFTYSVIIATVVLQGLSAGWLARLLGLRRPDPTGWLIVGAHTFGRAIARFIQEEAKLEVLLLDTNPRLVREARNEGLPALCQDALQMDEDLENPAFEKIGRVLALTDNPELNELVCHRWFKTVGRDNLYRWASELKKAGPPSGHIVFSGQNRPSLLSDELERGISRFSTATVEKEDSEPARSTLAAARPGRLLLPREGAPLQLKKGLRLLQLERSGGLLVRSFDSGDVIDIPGTMLESVVKRMNQVIQERFPQTAAEPLWDSANFSARQTLILPGKGVALGHQYTRVLKQRICFLARVPEGISLDSGAQKITLIFFLISPAGDAEGHLNTLAELARFCVDETNLQALRQLDRPSQVLNFIRSRAGGLSTWRPAQDPLDDPKTRSLTEPPAGPLP